MTNYSVLFLLLSAAVGSAILANFFWVKLFGSRDVTGQQLYASDTAKGVELSVYQERWNVCGHRSARQDWWATVIETKPGKFVRTGAWYKFNVGYPGRGRDKLPWCDPFRTATDADIHNARNQSKDCSHDTRNKPAA